MQSESVRNVLHKGHEGQIAARESEKCPSSPSKAPLPILTIPCVLRHLFRLSFLKKVEPKLAID
jgi:hypothetical protein